MSQYVKQVGITCGAIEEASRSSKAINERVIIHFRDKNALIAPFCEKMLFLFLRQSIMIYHDILSYKSFLSRNYGIFVAKIYDHALIDSF